MHEIRKIDVNKDIPKKMREEAGKAGLDFYGTRQVTFGYYIDGKLVAFCGYRPTREEGVCRFKNGWVEPEYRGMGLYSQLDKVRMESVKDEGYTKIVAKTTPMMTPIYRKRGWHIKRNFSDGGASFFLEI